MAIKRIVKAVNNTARIDRIVDVMRVGVSMLFWKGRC